MRLPKGSIDHDAGTLVLIISENPAGRRINKVDLLAHDAANKLIGIGVVVCFFGNESLNAESSVRAHR